MCQKGFFLLQTRMTEKKSYHKNVHNYIVYEFITPRHCQIQAHKLHNGALLTTHVPGAPPAFGLSMSNCAAIMRLAAPPPETREPPSAVNAAVAVALNAADLTRPGLPGVGADC